MSFRFLFYLSDEIQVFYLHLNMHYLDVTYHIGDVVSLRKKHKFIHDYAKV